MVKTGFDGVDKRFEEAQKDRGNIRQEMKEGFLNVNARFNMLEKDIKEFVTHDEFEDLMGG